MQNTMCGGKGGGGYGCNGKYEIIKNWLKCLKIESFWDITKKNLPHLVTLGENGSKRLWVGVD